MKLLPFISIEAIKTTMICSVDKIAMELSLLSLYGFVWQSNPKYKTFISRPATI